MTLDEAIKKYGAIDGTVWPNEAEFCSSLTIPSDIAKDWINTATGHPVHTIYCNKDIQGPLVEALQNISDKNLLSQLNTFDGCLNIRSIRSQPETISAHAYALAIDINSADNPLGQDAKISHDLVQCFKDAGWIWGGDFKRKDGMHFQYLASW